MKVKKGVKRGTILKEVENGIIVSLSDTPQFINQVYMWNVRMYRIMGAQ